MSLKDYKQNMELCCRCSYCKFISLEIVKGYKHVNVCPSIARYNFHAYSGGGRLNMAVGMLENRFDYTDKLLEVVYNCQMCGGCDISCKYVMDMEVLEPINEFRIKCVEEGHTIPALDEVIKGMREKGAMLPAANSKRSQWAEGMGVKDSTKQRSRVIYHAGCRTSYDKEMWKVARGTLNLLQKAQVDIGIAGDRESCCGGRAYEMGYKADFLRQAEYNMELFKKSGAEIVITGCSDCYYAFKVLYDKFGMKGGIEVLHATEYLNRLIKEKKLNPTKTLKAKITYHDPCHLGRLGESYIHWEGKEIPGHIRIFDPPKEFRRGTNGVYEAPREILRSIPGLKLVEMDRRKEYSWCCGAGGGVKETNPDFAKWTAKERIEEARSTGANAIVTACPGCEGNFRNTLEEDGGSFKVYDIVELLEQAI
jgi:Fe-S oxidoreductase